MKKEVFWNESGSESLDITVEQFKILCKQRKEVTEYVKVHRNELDKDDIKAKLQACIRLGFIG